MIFPRYFDDAPIDISHYGDIRGFFSWDNDATAAQLSCRLSPSSSSWSFQCFGCQGGQGGQGGHRHVTVLRQGAANGRGTWKFTHIEPGGTGD